MAQAKTADARRKSDLAMIHMTGKALFGDVSRGGAGRDAYEDWLFAWTGKRSSAALSVAARADFVKAIRREGLVPEKQKGGKGATRGGEDRPTKAQWAKIGGLARSMGWDKGLEDARLCSFVERTAKLSSTRFLTRKQASDVILGLEVWVKDRQRMDG